MGWKTKLTNAQEKNRNIKIAKYRNENKKRATRSEKIFRQLLNSLRGEYELNIVEQKSWKRNNGGFYLIDFYVMSPYNIAFEVDGPYHNDRAVYDNERDWEMTRAGVMVARIKNYELDKDPDRVLRFVKDMLDNRKREHERKEIMRRTIEQQKQNEMNGRRAALKAAHEKKMRWRLLE